MFAVAPNMYWDVHNFKKPNNMELLKFIDINLKQIL